MIELIRTIDLKTLMKWRREVISVVFGEEADSILMKENEDYYRRHITDGTHLAYIASFDGQEAGCGAICLSDELPSPDNPTGKCGYLMNIYVRNNFREHGVGHAIVKKLIEEAQNRGCRKIYLETTAIGRRLYESLGFHDLPDMMKLSK